MNKYINDLFSLLLCAVPVLCNLVGYFCITFPPLTGAIAVIDRWSTG